MEIIEVNEDGCCEVLGVAEGMKEDNASRFGFFRWLKRGVDGVKLIIGDYNGSIVKTNILENIMSQILPFYDFMLPALVAPGNNFLPEFRSLRLNEAS